MHARILSFTLATILVASSGCGNGGKSEATVTSTSTSTATVAGGGTSTALATKSEISTALATNSTTSVSTGSPTSTGATTSSGISTAIATNSATGAKTSGATATATTTATGTKTSGATATTTTSATGTTTGSGTGTCNYPECATKLFANCVADPCAGACVQQQSYMCGTTACPTPLTTAPTSMASNVCYANGVKSFTTIDMSNPTSMTAVIVVKKNGTVCYSYEMPYSSASGSGVTMILKDASGATVGTYLVNSTAKTATITCTGASPVVVSLDCISEQDTTTCPACTTGTCS